MDDEQLIGYCAIHAETPRALFHARHIKRMFELAGRPVPQEVLAQPDGFWSMHDDMKQLVREANKRRAKPRLALVP